MPILNDHTWAVLEKLADGFIQLPSQSEIADALKNNEYGISVEQVQKMVPSQLSNYRNGVERFLSYLPPAQVKLLLYVLNLLSYRAGAALLCRHGRTTAFKDMEINDVSDNLKDWLFSPLPSKRQLFRAFFSVCQISYVICDPIIYKAMGHPEFNYNCDPNSSAVDETFPRLNLIDFGPFAKVVEMEADVVIVGSGSGAGVAAQVLSSHGHKVIVIEKGKYFHPTEFRFNDMEAFEGMFEQKGAMSSEDNSICVIAGSTLGGGSAINWSASLEITRTVKKEWANSIPWMEGDELVDAYKYVYEGMGCTTEHIKHSKPNRMLLEGSDKLGWKCKEVPQNVGDKPHDCGFCMAGCRSAVKQSTTVNWLPRAMANGCQLISEATVKKIRRDPKTGAAIGVNALNNDGVKIIIRSKRVVISAGSLHTPLVLKRSGFRNSHIGKHLKLHPTIVINAIVDEDIDPLNHAILTTAVTEFSDLDGHGHGPLMEVAAHSPILDGIFTGWRPHGSTFLKKMLRYNNLCSFICITRDRGSGKVFATKDDPYVPRIAYTPSKFDCEVLHRSVVELCKLIYLEGGTFVDIPLRGVPEFESSKPRLSRTLQDKDFCEWLETVKNSRVAPLNNPFGSAHQMGSCRMGTDPMTSAVNTQGQLWECPTIYVADTSIFPEASGANPMLTCMAMSKIVAENVHDDLINDQNNSTSTARL